MGDMKHETTPALVGYFTFESVRPMPRPALTRMGGQYIVCTYIGAKCVKRDYFPTRELAAERIADIREGGAL
jgi:hypothetical protein